VSAIGLSASGPRNEKSPGWIATKALHQYSTTNSRLSSEKRRLSATKVAERAGISRNTLHLLEKGDSNTSITVLFQVLLVLARQTL